MRTRRRRDVRCVSHAERQQRKRQESRQLVFLDETYATTNLKGMGTPQVSIDLFRELLLNAPRGEGPSSRPANWLRTRSSAIIGSAGT